jgi:hypothetical protein
MQPLYLPSMLFSFPLCIQSCTPCRLGFLSLAHPSIHSHRSRKDSGDTVGQYGTSMVWAQATVRNHMLVSLSGGGGQLGNLNPLASLFFLKVN